MYCGLRIWTYPPQDNQAEYGRFLDKQGAQGRVRFLLTGPTQNGGDASLDGG